MAYLRNRSVNLLNLHYGVQALAMNGGGVFFAVFPLRAGVPVPAVLTALALLVAIRFVLRPLVLPLARRWGLKPLLIAGTVAVGLQYLLLAEVRGVGPALLALCVVAAIGDTLYWTCFHAAFASTGDLEHRGHQVGAREAAGAVAAILGPIAVGQLLVAFGPRTAFGITACVQVLSAAPLLGIRNVVVTDNGGGVFRAARQGIFVFVADGWITATYLFVWQIALFVSLGESFAAYGAAVAVAAMAGAAGGLWLGRHIDAGHGNRAIALMALTLGSTVLLKAASTQSAPLAVIANAVAALVGCLYIPTVMTAVYNQAKSSPCPLRFHIATEGGWDIGCAAGCLSAAALWMAGNSFAIEILLALLALPLMIAALRQYYSREPLTRPVAG